MYEIIKYFFKQIIVSKFIDSDLSTISTIRNNVNIELKEAIRLQKESLFQEAISLYENIIQSNPKNEIKSIALNNLIVAQYSIGEYNNAKLNYCTLLYLRKNMLIAYNELYAIDYAFTLIMGVEWFGASTENLIKAKSILNSVKDIFKKDYLKLINKIERLKVN